MTIFHVAFLAFLLFGLLGAITAVEDRGAVYHLAAGAFGVATGFGCWAAAIWLTAVLASASSRVERSIWSRPANLFAWVLEATGIVLMLVEPLIAAELSSAAMHTLIG